MGRRLSMEMWLGVIAILFAACGTTQEAREEDRVLEDFKVTLAERQMARRRHTAEVCLHRGVALPAQYQQKGGGMLEEYVASRPPCGIPAQERIDGAEADWRATWNAVVGTPVPVGYEWLLAAKRRIAAWLDAGGLAPAEAGVALREAQWVVTEWEERRALPAAAESGQASGGAEQTFAKLNTALNHALAEQGITCLHQGERKPCF